MPYATSYDSMKNKFSIGFANPELKNSIMCEVVNDQWNKVLELKNQEQLPLNDQSEDKRWIIFWQKGINNQINQIFSQILESLKKKKVLQEIHIEKSDPSEDKNQEPDDWDKQSDEDPA